jgi:hypothetical protein
MGTVTARGTTRREDASTGITSTSAPIFGGAVVRGRAVNARHLSSSARRSARVTAGPLRGCGDDQRVLLRVVGLPRGDFEPRGREDLRHTGPVVLVADLRADRLAFAQLE